MKKVRPMAHAAPTAGVSTPSGAGPLVGRASGRAVPRRPTHAVRTAPASAVEAWWYASEALRLRPKGERISVREKP